jgi:hypothetical protein
MDCSWWLVLRMAVDKWEGVDRLVGLAGYATSLMSGASTLEQEDVLLGTFEDRRALARDIEHLVDLVGAVLEVLAADPVLVVPLRLPLRIRDARLRVSCRTT